MRRTSLVGAALLTGAAVAWWVLVGRRLAEIEAELDRPDLERFAAARRLAEIEGKRSVAERLAPPKAA